MLGRKGAYLKQLTANLTMPSVEVGKELDGSSPPSVFIGSWNYPKVFAGPMIAPLHGDTRIMDTPESWIPANKTQEEIIAYRLNLVRGKHQVHIADLQGRFVGKIQEIALSAGSIESEVAFGSRPSGMSFSEESTPHGPSAPIEKLELGNMAWEPHLEKTYHDTDLSAAEAVIDLHRQGVPFSSIQKAFSVGTMGVARKRRLVPTRWSITAVDTTIGNYLLREVKRSPVIDTWQVRKFSSLNNHYAVILAPTEWQYEWMEAFLRLLGNEEMIFSDHEGHRGKREYSCVGGCYYSCKMAVLEALAREKRQAGAIILREASSGYIPLGVFNVRENVRSAMQEQPIECVDLPDALRQAAGKFTLPISRFIQESTLLKELRHERQATLGSFLKQANGSVPADGQ